MIYHVYAGYYEIYVSNKRLKKPLTLTYEAGTKSELNAYLMDIDDHILVDIDVYRDVDGEVICNEVFTYRNGKIKVIENFFEEN